MDYNKRESKSESYKKTKPMTPEQKLERGPVPEHFPKAWLGRDPEDDEVYAEHYNENDFAIYHDWPYRVEGAVFHNRDDMLNFAWELSRNQKRDVWFTTPTGFPQPTNWWCEERLTRDGEWSVEAQKFVEERRWERDHIDEDQPTIGAKIDPPSRAESQGRRKAYWDPKLKKTIITDEFEDSPISPNRQKQIEMLKKKGLDPDAVEAESKFKDKTKAPNAS